MGGCVACENMAVHFLHGSAHVDRQEANFGMLVLKDDKELVGEALPHPLKAVKIQRDLLKAIHAVAEALCLRARHR